jgi:hypothetical protein
MAKKKKAKTKKRSKSPVYGKGSSPGKRTKVPSY